jgi:hypothetical protein
MRWFDPEQLFRWSLTLGVIWGSVDIASDRTPLRRLEGRLRVVAGARLTLGNMRANGVRSLDVTTGDVSPPGGLGRSLCWSYSV